MSDEGIGGGVGRDGKGWTGWGLQRSNYTRKREGKDGFFGGNLRGIRGLFSRREFSGRMAPQSPALRYRADPNFSHAGLGFDQNTRAETPDTFAFLATGGTTAFHPKRMGTRGEDAPTVICRTRDRMIDAENKIRDDRQEFLANLPAGLAALEEQQDRKGDRQHNPGGMADSPVFAIVSHGRNRRGGASADTGQCIEIANNIDNANTHELQNAFYAFTNPPHPLALQGRHTQQFSPPPPAAA